MKATSDDTEERKERLKLIKQKYKNGVPKTEINALAESCAKAFIKLNYKGKKSGK